MALSTRQSPMRARGKLVYRGPRVRATFLLNRRELAKLARSPQVVRPLRQVVQDVALPHAISLSPERSGVYRRSFEVEKTQVTLAGRDVIPVRAAVRLHNTAPYALILEKGTQKRQGLRVLGKTLVYLHATAAMRA